MVHQRQIAGQSNRGASKLLVLVTENLELPAGVSKLVGAFVELPTQLLDLVNKLTNSPGESLCPHGLRVAASQQHSRGFVKG